jgi:uncharacterized DUF497 family protein
LWIVRTFQLKREGQVENSPGVSFQANTADLQVALDPSRVDRGGRWSQPVTTSVLFAEMYIQMYADGRLFSWDELKSAANLAERGFDFEFASLVFAGPTLEREDTRRDYGERRVISARQASRKECIAYEAAVKAGQAQSRPRGP